MIFYCLCEIAHTNSHLQSTFHKHQTTIPLFKVIASISKEILKKSNKFLDS
ncbi:hypothetical protein [Helicobacter himalayensis]|uniref:hypothetical protein n=1 Tax=Helicobacter himalayensis TaxID=1591088 RepID=UPI000AF46B6D|nr:hypothetical protein [Helicobacter himalayensis]